MNPDISIVMATFNGARFLTQQIESIRRQTLAPAELIVSDDGSSDETLKLVASATAGAPFEVRVVSNPRTKGFRRNFLEAASLARSPLVAFSDQDDIWRQDKLATMAEEFRDPRVLLAYHNASLIDAEGVPSGQLYGPDGGRKRSESSRTDPWSYSLGFTQMFRSELLSYSSLQAMGRDFLFVDKELAHDQWFYFLATCLGDVVFVDQPLVGYRQHEANVFGAVDRGRARRLQVLKATLDHSPVQLAAREDSLRAKACILDWIAADEAERLSRRGEAEAMASHHRELASLYTSRLGMYGNFDPRKAARWMKMATRSSALRKHGLSYPPRHAVRDLVFGVLFGHLAGPVD